MKEKTISRPSFLATLLAMPAGLLAAVGLRNEKGEESAFETANQSTSGAQMPRLAPETRAVARQDTVA